MSRQHSWILVGAVAAVGASCSSDLNDPAPIRPPAAMELAYGDNQVGVAGSPLAQHITVKVTDEHGTPLRGVTVAFEVTAGGGNLGSPADLTDTEGFARAAWTLGSEPGIGTQQATATIAGTSIAPVTFSARAASQLVKRGGDAQTAEVLHGVAEAPTVVVRDAADRPVAGMTVHWAVTSGGGRVESPTFPHRCRRRRFDALDSGQLGRLGRFRPLPHGEHRSGTRGDLQRHGCVDRRSNRG